MVARESRVPVSDVMTRQVCTASPDRPLGEVFEILKKERCHHVPIVEGERPVGMISARDVLHLARRHAGGKTVVAPGTEEIASDAMTRDLVTIHTDESVDRAIDRIGRGDIHALVVVDDDDHLAGIVTHNDLLQYLIE